MKCTLLPLGILLASVAAAQSTRPASGPANPQQIRQWVIGLTDADPAVRERSADELLGLKRADLAAVKQVLKELALPDPALKQEMSQIVMHVYLSEAAYQPLPRGFLGVRMPTEEAGREADPKVQIVIESRLPGFDAYRKLRNGDGILDVEERPLRQPPDRSDFIDKVGAMRAGSEIHLKVLREGKVIRIAVRTGAFPAEIDAMTAGSADQFNDRRKAAAEKYVKEEFGALLEWE